MSANKRPRIEYGSDVPKRPRPEDPAEQKVRKACINCRRQKMKCVVESANSTCRRCQRSELRCVFVPRVNSVTLPDHLLPLDGGSEFKGDVMRRLKIIEDCLGLPDAREAVEPEIRIGESNEDLLPEYTALAAVWEAMEVLRASAPSSVPSSIWRKSSVKQLWSSFHDRMPGLHFMYRKQTFSAPNPLLLASILYCSSTRGPPDSAMIAPHYLTVLSNAISQLCVPGSEIRRPPDNAEEWAFQTVLGIVLAGLLTEASVRETGIWISVAYRLVLEHCPAQFDETTREWRNLFSGVQIIDLEHASLHLSCPVIPIEPPLPGLQTSNRDQLYRLSRMMHTGLTHFAGRGLPNIWSCFGEAPQVNIINLTSTFTAVDAAVIRDWARQLDEWLVEFGQRFEGSEQDRQLVFRQYVLHRLVVLSIYHPARGCDLWSRSITPKEQYELLLSARATVKLHFKDEAIWSNWDLIMITWAALIVIQGIEGAIGEADDLNNIRVHLNMLKQMNGPKPSFCDKLIARLEESLCGVHTPGSADIRENAYDEGALGSDIDLSWQIFDQASLQQMIYPIWSASDQLAPASV